VQGYLTGRPLLIDAYADLVGRQHKPTAKSGRRGSN
jgi:hypothetical protein